MPPAEAPSCQTRETLKARMRADLKVYKDAVVELDQSSGLDFKKARQRAEHTRLAYEAARDMLEAHIAAHACA
jgi:hypothetical protein